MSRRGRRNLPDVGLVVCVVVVLGLVGLVVGVLGGGILVVCVFVVLVLDVLGGAVIGVLGDLLGGLLSGVRVCVDGVLARRPGSRAPARGHTVPLLAAPRSLRWVRGVLPDGEGATWLAEVSSCLAEAATKSERHRYVRSYRRTVPQLIWTSWAEHLSASHRRELL
jgi:hypothetical protein